MKTLPKFLVAFLLGLALPGSTSRAADAKAADAVKADDAKTAEAVKAAESWLKLVDGGKYKESWTEAAGFFKERVTEVDWTKMIGLARKPFGDVEGRKLLKATYATSLPGAPDGEYVVIQFQTTFSKKKDSVETITPMKDADGKWRVSGYFIK